MLRAGTVGSGAKNEKRRNSNHLGAHPAGYFFDRNPGGLCADYCRRKHQGSLGMVLAMMFGPVNLWNYPKQQRDYMHDLTYEETLQKMHEICAERYAMREDIRLTRAHHELAGHALDYHNRHLRLLALLTFCRTGKYPK